MGGLKIDEPQKKKTIFPKSLKGESKGNSNRSNKIVLEVDSGETENLLLDTNSSNNYSESEEDDSSSALGGGPSLGDGSESTNNTNGNYVSVKNFWKQKELSASTATRLKPPPRDKFTMRQRTKEVKRFGEIKKISYNNTTKDIFLATNTHNIPKSKESFPSVSGLKMSFSVLDENNKKVVADLTSKKSNEEDLLGSTKIALIEKSNDIQNGTLKEEEAEAITKPTEDLPVKEEKVITSEPEPVPEPVSMPVPVPEPAKENIEKEKTTPPVDSSPKQQIEEEAKPTINKETASERRSESTTTQKEETAVMMKKEEVVKKVSSPAPAPAAPTSTNLTPKKEQKKRGFFWRRNKSKESNTNKGSSSSIFSRASSQKSKESLSGSRKMIDNEGGVDEPLLTLTPKTTDLDMSVDTDDTLKVKVSKSMDEKTEEKKEDDKTEDPTGKEKKDGVIAQTSERRSSFWGRLKGGKQQNNVEEDESEEEEEEEEEELNYLEVIKNREKPKRGSMIALDDEVDEKKPWRRLIGDIVEEDLESVDDNNITVGDLEEDLFAKPYRVIVVENETNNNVVKGMEDDKSEKYEDDDDDESNDDEEDDIDDAFLALQSFQENKGGIQQSLSSDQEEDPSLDSHEKNALPSTTPAITKLSREETKVFSWDNDEDDFSLATGSTKHTRKSSKASKSSKKSKRKGPLDSIIDLRHRRSEIFDAMFGNEGKDDDIASKVSRKSMRSIGSKSTMTNKSFMSFSTLQSYNTFKSYWTSNTKQNKAQNDDDDNSTIWGDFVEAVEDIKKENEMNVTSFEYLEDMYFGKDDYESIFNEDDRSMMELKRFGKFRYRIRQVFRGCKLPRFGLCQSRKKPYVEMALEDGGYFVIPSNMNLIQSTSLLDA